MSLILVSGGTATLGSFLSHPSIGVLLTPDLCKPKNLALAKKSHTWAADNSAFKGFNPARFCGFLGKISKIPGCRWVSCPDVVANSKVTLSRFNLWQPILAELGLPVAYVAQDGSEQLDLPWGRVACLFVGGTTEWKLSQSSVDLIREAKRRDRWVHVGRVNSQRRCRWCLEHAVDSVDGSGFGMFPATNIPKGIRWLTELPATQPTLPKKASTISAGVASSIPTETTFITSSSN